MPHVIFPSIRLSAIMLAVGIVFSGMAPAAETAKREGPKTYPLSGLFLESAPTTPTPRGTPTPPPSAFDDPVLAPRTPSGRMPSFDAASSSSGMKFALAIDPTATPAPPTPTPRPTATPSPFATPSAKSPLDINGATLEQLTTLPGINPDRAELILAHRQAIGGFRNVQQLREVFGISEEMFLKLRPLVKAGPVPKGLFRPVTPGVGSAFVPVPRPAYPDVGRGAVLPAPPQVSGQPKPPQPALPAPPSVE